MQKTFNIEKEAAFFLTVKNPLKNAAQSSGSSTATPTTTPVALPEHLVKVIGNRLWLAALPLSILNYVGIEMVLIGESNDIGAEFGEVGKELEQEEKRDEAKASTYQLFEELRLTSSECPIEPLLHGRWK